MGTPIETWRVCQDCLDVKYSQEMDDCSFLVEGVNYEQAIKGWKSLGEFVEEHYGNRETLVSETGNHNEFSWIPCQCCNSRLGGRRFEFGLFLFGDKTKEVANHG